MKKLALISLFPCAIAWPICIAYVLYLGFSRNEWLDDLFFHWEGISLALLPFWLIGGSLWIAILTESRRDGEKLSKTAHLPHIDENS
jgi:hypothetical protein